MKLPKDAVFPGTTRTEGLTPSATVFLNVRFSRECSGCCKASERRDLRRDNAVGRPAASVTEEGAAFSASEEGAEEAVCPAGFDPKYNGDLHD